MEERKKLYFIYNPHSGREQIRTKLYHIQIGRAHV